MARHLTLRTIYQAAFLFALSQAGRPRIALFITDVQRCFTSGGTLAVDDADDIIDVINGLRRDHGHLFDLIVHSQDWHCHNHVSFASQYPTHGIYDIIELDYNGDGELCRRAEVNAEYSKPCVNIRHKLNQTLWPDHCIKNTFDAEFHPRLNKTKNDIVVQKGFHCQIDSYSMFYDNGEFSQTDLNKILQDEHIDTLFMTGLALDYCVHWTAREAKDKFGYNTYVIVDATRPVTVATGEMAKDDMEERGIILVNSDEVGDILIELRSGAGRALAKSFLIISVCVIISILLN